jgi:hypothetical protein
MDNRTRHGIATRIQAWRKCIIDALPSLKVSKKPGRDAGRWLALACFFLTLGPPMDHPTL